MTQAPRSRRDWMRDVLDKVMPLDDPARPFMAVEYGAYPTAISLPPGITTQIVAAFGLAPQVAS